jgi:hypothetical protein
MNDIISSKRILVLSHTIYPAQFPRSYRATELAIEFARLGHLVTLAGVLGEYDYSEFEKTHHLKVEDIGRMDWVSLKSSGANKRSFLNKVGSKLLKKWMEFPDIEFLWKVPLYLKTKSDIDLLISIGMPHPIHWGTALAKKRLSNKFPAKWIADCGDPYMGNKVTKIKPAFYFKYFEKEFCRQADYITIPIKDALQGYYQEFWYKIKIIPQGFRFDDIDKIEEFKPNTIPTFAYAGIFYKDFRDPTSFLEYLATLDRPFKFIVFTKSIGFLEPFKERLKEKLEVCDYIPREDLLNRLKRMDFLVNFENNTKVQSPSKLIDYALTGRPVLSLNGSKLSNSKIEQFLNGDYAQKFILKNIEDYDIKNVAQKFIRLTQK